MFQKTVKNVVEFSGIGVHTGADARVRILPADADTGICFVRKDLPGTPVIKAVTKNVVSTNYATTLGLSGVTVSTVEHLLATFYGMGVDNCLVEVEGPEIPVLDGSALPFVELIEDAGVETLDKAKRYMVIKKPIKVSGEGKFIHLLPSPERGFFIDYTIDFAHPVLDKQSFSMSFSSGTTFSREVAGARTFGFLRDVELLRANGLAKGGSLKNAVVVGDKDILNEGGLRYPDEFVRHKVLDLLGDLSLVGVPIVGRIKAHRAGHALNFKLAQRVRKSSGKWKMVDSRVSSLNEEAAKHYPALGQGLATA